MIQNKKKVRVFLTPLCHIICERISKTLTESCEFILYVNTGWRWDIVSVWAFYWALCVCCMIAPSFGCGETYKVINLDCDPSKARQMKFTAWKIFVCDGKEWKALQYKESFLGSRKYPGSSCKKSKTDSRNAANGIYWIAMGGRLSRITHYSSNFFVTVTSLNNGAYYFHHAVLLVFPELRTSFSQ